MKLLRQRRAAVLLRAECRQDVCPGCYVVVTLGPVCKLHVKQSGHLAQRQLLNNQTLAQNRSPQDVQRNG